MPSVRSLDSLERFGWRFGLDSVRALLAELGDPHLGLRFIHVAGSNGKGSTCAFLSSVLRRAGYRTGLYTSPHLSDLRERFRLDGAWIPAGDLRRLEGKVLDACGRAHRALGHSPTQFEALTALAFLWFQERRADWVVLETGLGGRLDATNVIPTPALALITPLGLEHEDILGKGLTKIAGEKAGILKAGGSAATHQPHREALRVLDTAARDRGAVLWASGRDFNFTPTPKGFHWEGPGLDREFRLDGPSYQAANAALAVAGIRLLEARGVHLGEGKMGSALRRARWPGRMEKLGKNPLVVMDGAHNPEASGALAASLRRRYPGRRWVVLNGFLKDKDHAACARLLAPLTQTAVVTEPANARAEAAIRVFQGWEKAGVGGVVVRDWRQALALALLKARRGDGLLVTGSLYLLGDCRRAISGLRGLDRI